MRTVKFKKTGAKIVFVAKGKADITPETLTIELYDKLVAKNPNYKKLFIVTDEEAVETEDKKSRKKKILDIDLNS